MKRTPRIVWELLTLVLLGLAAWGVWTWTQHRWQDRLATTEHELRAQLAEERRQRADAAREQAEREATAVAEAVAAGMRPAVAAGRNADVEATVTELLQLPGLVFVHVLDGAGAVIASSDRKLIATGQAGPRAGWALSAREVTARPGTTPGAAEVAVPIVGAAGFRAVLWLAYAPARPPSPSGAEPAPAPPEESTTEPATEGETI